MSDYISRQAAIKAIDDLPNCYNGYSDTYDKACIIGVLEELPPIEPKKGKWIYKPTEPLGYECSVCGKGCCRFKYCPNCGAKMDVADNDVGKMERGKE